jgi:hypothetical protein
LYTFTGNEVVDVMGNDGTYGDQATLALIGTNAVDQFRIDLNAAGTTAAPIAQLRNGSGGTLLTLRNYSSTFSTLKVYGLDGADAFNVYTGSAIGRNVFCDGGLPTAKKKSTDKLTVYYVMPKPRIIHSAATQNPGSGLVDLLYGTGARSVVQYADMENVVITK